jgi:hypothetical protein
MSGAGTVADSTAGVLSFAGGATDRLGALGVVGGGIFVAARWLFSETGSRFAHAPAATRTAEVRIRDEARMPGQRGAG